MTSDAGATAPQNLRSAIEAALILAVGMGFGRFAFTAVFPHMVAEGMLSLRAGSLAASANYAGYLLGAVLAARMHAHDAHRLCLWSVMGTALCLGVLALPVSVWILVVVRGAAGAFSALSMVASSLWLLEQRRHFKGAPLLYAGVGAGIALSAELLAAAGYTGLHSAGMWAVLSVVSLTIGLAAAPGLVTRHGHELQVTGKSAAVVAVPIAIWPLVTIYGLAGLGYIITATYLPLLAHTALPDLDSAHVWAVFGVGAAPSCFFWHRIHERLGTRVALQFNLFLQAIGVALSARSESAGSYLLSALLVGGTFMGTVTIAMPAAQQAARRTGKNLLGTMAVVYGVGQIAGPAVVELLQMEGHGLSTSLALAAAALILGGLLCFRL